MRKNTPVVGIPCDRRLRDGAIEAISKPDAAAFVLGVQWHPRMEIR